MTTSSGGDGAAPGPPFSSFDDAWRWFRGGGTIAAARESREALGGRAQLLALQLRADTAAVRQAAQRALDELADIPGLLPSSMEHLHVTLCIAGYQVVRPHRPDEIARPDVDRMARDAGRVLKDARRVTARLGPVNVLTEALVLEVHDGGASAELRARLAAATGIAHRARAAAPYLPHVTIATFEAPAASERLRACLSQLWAWPPEPVELRRVEFARWWFTGLDESEPPELDVVRAYALR